jgi:uncharacterized membrane protein
MWLIIGLIIGAGLVALWLWLRGRRIVVTWSEWLIGILGLALLLFAIQNFTASFAEHEEHAAWTFLWVFGVPAVVLLTIASLLPWLRYRRTANQSTIHE